MFLEEYKNLIISQNAKMKNITQYTLVGTVDNEICWDPHTAGETSCNIRKITFDKRNWILFVRREVQGHQETRTPPHFVLQQILESDYSKELYHIGLYVKENHGSYQAASSRTRSTSSLLHARQHLGQKPKQEVQGLHTLLVPAQLGLRGGHRRRAEGELQVLPNAQWLRCLLRHDHQGVHLESDPQKGHSRYKSRYKSHN